MRKGISVPLTVTAQESQSPVTDCALSAAAKRTEAVTILVIGHWWSPCGALKRRDLVGRRSQTGGKLAHAGIRVATTGFEQPELLQLVLAGIGLKEALRLVFGDKPVDDDLVIEGVAIAKAGIAVEDEGGPLAAGARERLAGNTAEEFGRRVRRARVGPQQQGTESSGSVAAASSASSVAARWCP